MHPVFVTNAILLAAVATGETDRVVTLYSREHGKLSAIAKGARKSRNRFGASLALFVAGEASLRDRRGSDLLFMERFDAREDHSRLGEDVVKLAHASYATELLRELTVPRQPDAALFDLLLEVYRVIAETTPRSATLRAFELRLLDELGLRPVLDRCLLCGSEALAVIDADGALVDSSRGGLICARCAATARFPADAIRRLPPAARLYLMTLRATSSIAEAVALPGPAAEVETAARQAMHALVHSHLRVPMRSLEFIRQLRAGT